MAGLFSVPRQGLAINMVNTILTYHSHNAVHNILTNPIYAGAYAFGRTGRSYAGNWVTV
jgi:hypothetical protein